MRSGARRGFVDGSDPGVDLDIVCSGNSVGAGSSAEALQQHLAGIMT